MSLARVGENKGARKPANLLFEGLFSGVALWVMVVYFQCLWTASWATLRSRLLLILTRRKMTFRHHFDTFLLCSCHCRCHFQSETRFAQDHHLTIKIKKKNQVIQKHQSKTSLLIVFLYTPRGIQKKETRENVPFAGGKPLSSLAFVVIKL